MNILVIDGDLSEGKIKNAYRKGNCETLIRFNILAKSLEIRWPKSRRDQQSLCTSPKGVFV